MSRSLCGCGAGMSRAKWWLWASISLCVLVAMMWLLERAAIETNIQERTSAVLSGAGHDWAQADLNQRGRDVALRGVAPSVQARLDAIELIKNVNGVRIVADQTSLLALSSASFSIKHQGSKVELTGLLPNQSSIDSSVNAAAAAYGAKNIINRLNVSPAVREPQWLSTVMVMMPTLRLMEQSQIDITDDRVNLVGQVAHSVSKNAVMRAAQEGFPDNLKASISIVPKGPSAEDLAKMMAQETAQIATHKTQAAETRRRAAQARANFISDCETSTNSTLTAQNIRFGSADSPISSTSHAVLNQIADIITRCQSALLASAQFIEIEGPFSAAAAIDKNIVVSTYPAVAVRDYLIGAGVPRDLVKVAGNGQHQSITNNDLLASQVQSSHIKFNIKP